MARTNYSFEKRQKELAKIKKKEEKKQRKLEKQDSPAMETDPVLPPEAEESAGKELPSA